MVTLVPNINSNLSHVCTHSSDKVAKHKPEVYVESFGCTANKFDLEIIIGHLEKAGFKLTFNLESADIMLINTCGVKKPTEDRIIERLRRLNGLGKPLIISGCLPIVNLRAVLKSAPNFSAILGPQSLDIISTAVKRALKGANHQIYNSKNRLFKLKQPRSRLNPVVEIISISEGCTGSCSFCCVRFARGSLVSYALKDIVDTVQSALYKGVREIWLTSQDTGIYGLDIGTNLTELLTECCKIKGKFRIRIGMMNPNSVKPILPKLIESYKNNKIFKFLHLPVQSGDKMTLERMNRKYTAEEFTEIVNKFRKVIPSLTLSTDVICGFPGESQKGFEKTIKLLENIQPDIINISKFFPRPKTSAEKMVQIPPMEVKNRSRQLTRIARKLSRNKNQKWLNWQGEVIIDEKGKDTSWICRNFAYKPIVIRSKEHQIGSFVSVRVSKAFSTYLEGKLASYNSP